MPARSAIISNRLWIPFERFTAEEITETKARLTYTPKKFAQSDEEDTKPIYGFALDAKRKMMGVPVSFGLLWCEKHGVPIEEELAGGRPITVPKGPTALASIEGQEEFFDAVLERVKSHDVGVFDGATGVGKSATVCHVIYSLKRTTLIIVPTRAIADGWIDELHKHNGFAREDIGFVGNGEYDYEDHPVTIGIINTITQKEHSEDFLSHFGIVAIDEADTLGARTFSKAMALFPAMHRLTLTATPYRKDGLWDMVEDQYGRVSVECEADALPCEVQVLNYNKRWWGNTNPNALPTAILLNIIVKDPERNDLLAAAIARMHKLGRNILGLSDRTEQLTLIRELLISKHGIPAKDIGIYARSIAVEDGKGKLKGRKLADTQELARIKKEARIILGTYGMCGRGWNVPRLDGGIDLSPRADATQGIGRIRRPESHRPDKYPVWFTVRDRGVGSLMGYTKARLRLWGENNCTIVD